MKLPTIALFLFVFNLSYTQDLAEKNISYGFEIQAATIKIDGLYDVTFNRKRTIGLSLSGYAFINIFKNVSLKTGLSLNQRTIKSKDYTPFLPCDIDPITGPDFTQSWYQHKFPIFYLGIPVQFKWNFTNKKKHFYLKTGVETFVKIAAQSNSIFHECGDTSNEVDIQLIGLNKFHVLGEAGIGYEFQLKNKTQMHIEPIIEFSLHPVFNSPNTVIGFNSDPKFSRYLNFGLATGISF